MNHTGQPLYYGARKQKKTGVSSNVTLQVSSLTSLCKDVAKPILACRHVSSCKHCKELMESPPKSTVVGVVYLSLASARTRQLLNDVVCY